MKQNYQLMLDKIIKDECADRRPRLLLHACCAPCSSYVLEYLSEYFDKDKLYQNPYEEDLKNVKSISIEADGTLFGKSIYSESIMDILEAYELSVL